MRLGAAQRANLTGLCGEIPKPSSLLMYFTVCISRLSMTNKSSVEPLHVGTAGLQIFPSTSSAHPDASSASGGRFQSPMTIHGPRTAFMRLAKFSNTALFFSDMPSFVTK